MIISFFNGKTSKSRDIVKHLTHDPSFCLDSIFSYKMPDVKDGDFNDKYGSWWGIDNDSENICSVSTQT